jgi:hypothetical protein
MTAFYVDSKAPKLVKSAILKLLSRLIKKLRIIYLETACEKDYSPEDHFKLQFVSPDFTQSLLNELFLDMDEEVKNHNKTHAGKGSILYSSFVQNGAEFLMNLIVPCYRNARLPSFRDLLVKGIPGIKEGDWADGLIRF